MTFKKYKAWVLEDPRSEKLDFNPDGRNHYVYRVSKDEHYYGSKSELLGISEDTIGNGYFTSSNYLEESFKAAPEDYRIKIVRRFDNSADKIIFESYLHQYFDVKNHDSFINRSNQTPWGFDTTGSVWSEETRQKILNTVTKKRQDSVEYGKLKKNHSNASIKRNASLNADPKRYAKKVEKNRIATAKSQAEILANPERALKRHIKLSEAASKTVYEYDKDRNFIREFSSQKAATDYYSIKNKSGINHCIIGRQLTCNNSIWSLTRLEDLDS